MTDSGHLTEADLHSVLDGALAEAEAKRARFHLSACPECARRLEATAQLFAAIESWEDLPLRRDLSSGVLHALGGRTPRRFGPAAALGLQAALTGAIVVLGWPLLTGFVRTAIGPVLAGIDGAGLANSVMGLDTFAASVEAVGEMLLVSAEGWLASAAAQTTVWPLLAAGAAVAAGIGNSLLLRRARDSRTAGAGRL